MCEPALVLIANSALCLYLASSISCLQVLQMTATRPKSDTVVAKSDTVNASTLVPMQAGWMIKVMITTNRL